MTPITTMVDYIRACILDLFKQEDLLTVPCGIEYITSMDKSINQSKSKDYTSSLLF